jgi:hypothetical protein
MPRHRVARAGARAAQRRRRARVVAHVLEHQPPQVRVREQAESVRRIRKLVRKRLEREGY